MWRLMFTSGGPRATSPRPDRGSRRTTRTYATPPGRAAARRSSLHNNLIMVWLIFIRCSSRAPKSQNAIPVTSPIGIKPLPFPLHASFYFFPAHISISASPPLVSSPPLRFAASCTALPLLHGGGMDLQLLTYSHYYFLVNKPKFMLFLCSPVLALLFYTHA